MPSYRFLWLCRCTLTQIALGEPLVTTFSRIVLLPICCVLFLSLILACSDNGTTADGGHGQSERCVPASSDLVSALSDGLTVSGGGSISNVYTVKNNDGRPYTFIAGRVTGPGLSETLVWATPSLDLDGSALIVATDSLSEEFSVWSLPGGNRFADQFDDDIRAAKGCAEAQ